MYNLIYTSLPISSSIFYPLYAVHGVAAQSTEYKYVMVHNDSITWADANAYCASKYGTTLATIKDDTDAATLLAMRQSIGSYHMWVGLNDIATEGVWEWASGYEWYIALQFEFHSIF